MNIPKILIAVILASSIAVAQDYSIDWYVIGSGGESSSSGSYSVNGTIGQPIVGQTSSMNYTVDAGFWAGVGEPSGYDYVPGDANGDGQVIGSDVTFLVNYFRGVAQPRPDQLFDGFWAAADVNGDCQVIGSDVTRLVNYFRGIGTISWCPQYPPNP